MRYSIKFIGDTPLIDLLNMACLAKECNHLIGNDLFMIPPHKGDYVDLMPGGNGPLQNLIYDFLSFLNNENDRANDKKWLSCLVGPENAKKFLSEFSKFKGSDEDRNQQISLIFDVPLFEVVGVVHLTDENPSMLVILNPVREFRGTGDLEDYLMIDRYPNSGIIG